MVKKKERKNESKYGFYTSLSDRFEQNKKKYYYYFLWKNHLNNSGETDFSNMSEEDFIKKYTKKRNPKEGDEDGSEISFKRLQMWESSDEYQALMQELYAFKMNQDFYSLYETYLAKAMEGDSQAVNSLKIIKKEIESLNKTKKVSNKVNEDEEKFDMK